jgi:hypothetical protein
MEISFKKDVMPILIKYGACHQGFGGYDTLIKKVVPGKPEVSKFYQRMINEDQPIMPPAGKLNDDLLRTIYLWIQQGAKNN